MVLLTPTHTHKCTRQQPALPECIINVVLVTKHLSCLLVTYSLNPYDIDPHAQRTIYGSWSMKRYLGAISILKINNGLTY